MERSDESRTLAELYHEETKYSEERLRNAPPFSLDPEQQPEPYKEYHSQRAVSLVPYLPFEDFPLTGARIDPHAADIAADPILPRLSRLLYFTNGVTAIYRGHHGISLFRASPSAGALYPTEIYVVTEGIEGIPNGLHNYSIRRHELVPVFDGSLADELSVCCFGHSSMSAARAVVILSGIYERSAWRYQERSYRRVLLDTGHVLGNLLHVGATEGLFPQPLGCFADEFLSQLLFFEPHQEGVLAVVPLVEEAFTPGFDREALATSHATCLRRSPTGGSHTVAGHNGEELFLSLHRGSSLDHESLELLGPNPESLPRQSDRDERPRVSLEGRHSKLERGLYDVIIERRSTRQFSGDSFTVQQLGKIFDYAYGASHRGALPGIGCAIQAPELLETYVVSFNLEGLESGVYRYHADSHQLELCRSGDFFTECHRFCLHQGVQEGAAALVVHTSHLANAISCYGDRAYRYLHLDAGVIGQGLNLAAIDLRLGASGIGGFLDDEVNEVLGLQVEHAIVYLTALGVPQPADT